MKIISLKPCLFGGKKYEPGEEIPPDIIEHGRIKTLIRIGTIALQEDEPMSKPDVKPKKKVQQ